MEIARSFRLVKHFPNPDMAGPVRNSPVEGIAFLVAQDRGADARANRQLPNAVVRILRVNQRNFHFLVVHLQQGLGVHRDDILRHLPWTDDDGALDLVLQLKNVRAVFELDQALEPGLVDFGDVDGGGVGRGAFAQEPEVALRVHGKRFHRKRFAFQHEAAAQEDLQRPRVVRVDLGDELLGPHVEEGELHAFADRAGAELAAPVVAVADDQDHFAVRALLDEPHEAHGHVMPVVGHEEPAALVEQMGEDRHLDPADDLLDEPGDVARIAQVARDALVFQPVHQCERVGPGDLRTQGNERLVHLHPIGFQV